MNRGMRASLTLLCLALATATASCAQTASSNVCEQAQAHIESCLGVTAAAGTCDPAQAEAILAEDCSALKDGKADQFAGALCKMGIYSQCPIPACEVQKPSQTCSDYINRDDCSQCDYYLCREAQTANNGCGPTGYYEGFGDHYCRLYKDVVADKLSPHGQQFAYKVRRCLMVTMEKTIPLESSCSDVKAAAYASHQQCYIDAGFCQLSMGDRIAVLASISPKDLDLKLALKTIADCF